MPKIKISPTIYVGLGGTGLRFIQEMKRQLYFQRGAGDATRWMVPFTRFVGIDTAKKDSNQSLASRDEVRRLLDERFIDRELTWLNPKAARHDTEKERYERFFFAKVSDAVVRGVVREQGMTFTEYGAFRNWFDPSCLEGHVRIEDGAAQKRMLGRFCFFVNFFQIRDLLKEVIADLADAVTQQMESDEESCGVFDHDTYELDREPSAKGIRIVVVGGLGGGTGSGFFLDTCYLIRMLQSQLMLAGMDESNNQSLTLYGFLPDLYWDMDPMAPASDDFKDRTSCNGMAALQDINFFQQYRGKFESDLRKRTMTDPFRPFSEKELKERSFDWNWGNVETPRDGFNKHSTHLPLADRVYLVGRESLRKKLKVGQAEAVQMAVAHAVAVRGTNVAFDLRANGVNDDDGVLDLVRDFTIGNEGSGTSKPKVFLTRLRGMGVSRRRTAENETRLAVAALVGNMALSEWLEEGSTSSVRESLPSPTSWSAELDRMVDGSADLNTLRDLFPADTETQSTDDGEGLRLRLPAERFLVDLDKEIASLCNGGPNARWHRVLFGARKDIAGSILVRKGLSATVSDLLSTIEKIEQARSNLQKLCGEFALLAAEHQNYELKLNRLRDPSLFVRMFGARLHEEVAGKQAETLRALKRTTRNALEQFAWLRCEAQYETRALSQLREYVAGLRDLGPMLSTLVGAKERMRDVSPFVTLFNNLVPIRNPHPWEKVEVPDGYAKEDDGSYPNYERIAKRFVSSHREALRASLIHALFDVDPGQKDAPFAWISSRRQMTGESFRNEVCDVRDKVFKTAFEVARGIESPDARPEVADRAEVQLPIRQDWHPRFQELERFIKSSSVRTDVASVSVTEASGIAIDQVDLSPIANRWYVHVNDGDEGSTFWRWAQSDSKAGRQRPLPAGYQPHITAQIVRDTLLLLVLEGKMPKKFFKIAKHDGFNTYEVNDSKFYSVGQIIDKAHRSEKLRRAITDAVEQWESSIRDWSDADKVTLHRVLRFNRQHYQLRGRESKIKITNATVDTTTEHFYWDVLEKSLGIAGIYDAAKDRMMADREEGRSTTPWAHLSELVDWRWVSPTKDSLPCSEWNSGLVVLAKGGRVTEDVRLLNVKAWNKISGLRKPATMTDVPWDDHAGNPSDDMDAYSRPS